MIAGLALNLPLELRYVIGRLRGRSAAESISVEDAMALVAGVAGGMDPCRAKMYRLRRTGRHSR